MSPGLRRGIFFALLAELPGFAAVAVILPSLAAHNLLVALVVGVGVLVAGTAIGLGGLVIVSTLSDR